MTFLLPSNLNAKTLEHLFPDLKFSLFPGCRHGSFQPQGSLGNRTHDFLQELLAGGKITFTVPASPASFTKGDS